MKSLRNYVENAMTTWSLSVVRYRWVVLILVLLVTGGVLPQLQNITLNVSGESFLPENNPAVSDYNAFRDQFGYSSVGLITVKTDESLFNMKNLRRLRALHEDLAQNMPYLEEITSLVNVRHSHASESMLNVDELIEFWPENDSELPAFKALVLQNPAYVGNIIAASGLLTNIVLQPHTYSDSGDDAASFEDLEETDAESTDDEQQLFLNPEEEEIFVKSLLEIRNRHEAPGFTLYAGGMPVLNHYISNDLGEGMTRDMILGLIVIAILLFLLFRRTSGVWMPLLCVMLSITMTFALTAVFGVPLYSTAQVLPTFLLAVGIADAVHIQSVFYKLYDNGMEKHEAIVTSMRKTAVAVLMTSLTTAASLLSFAASEVQPTRMLGTFGAIGVLLALYYSIALIPALLAILPVRRRSKNNGEKFEESAFLRRLDTLIFALGDFGVRHARYVVFASLIFCVIAAAGLSHLRIGHDPLRWHPPDHPTRVSAELVDKEMNGTVSLEILIDTQKENGVQDPVFLNFLEQAEQLIEETVVQNTRANEVVSILSVIKETHKALNNNDPDYYSVSADREVIAQELLLFETSGSDDTNDFVDSQFQLARLTAITPWTDSIAYGPYIEAIERDLGVLWASSELEGVSIKMTGMMVMFSKVVTAMLEGTLKSYGIAFSLVGLLMLILMGSIRRGLLACVPTAIPILFTLGLMGWMGIPLNLLTSMVGCIIIGIAVDDTIHFMHHYRKAANTQSDARLVVRMTLDNVGRAIVFTSLVLVAGFLVHLQDQFSATRHYGILLAFSIVVALFANLVVAPALMTMMWHTKASDRLPHSA